MAFTQTSQELRLISPRNRYFVCVAGLYFMSTDSRERYMRVVNGYAAPDDPLPLGSGVNHFGAASRNYAAFGEMNVNLTPDLRAFLGYRQIWDRQTFHTDRVATILFNFLPGRVTRLRRERQRHRAGMGGRTGLRGHQHAIQFLKLTNRPPGQT